MKNKPDGGPAFPVEFNYIPSGATLSTSKLPGMSLRDWFAGMALQGLIANDIYAGKERDGNGWQELADMAYGTADAMLEERLK